MPLKALQTMLIPLCSLTKTATECAQNPDELVLRVIVPVFAALRNSFHQGKHVFSVILSGKCVVINIFVVTTVHSAEG